MRNRIDPIEAIDNAQKDIIDILNDKTRFGTLLKCVLLDTWHRLTGFST